jgi:DNA polymerase-1
LSDPNKLMLIDTHSLMNRAFYGIAGRRRLTAPDGTPTGALYAFLNMILKFQADLEPSHVIAAMDMPGKTFRHAIDASYKAERRPMPDDLAVQIPIAREMLEALGFCPTGLEGYEADDVIGTLAHAADRRGMTTTIITGDRDALQLVSDRTTVLLLTTKASESLETAATPEAMVDTYGVRPDQWVDVKALMGDSSDNIPGVKGVGKKTALRLIQTYGSLDAVYQHLDEQKGALLKNLTAGRDAAYLSQTLSEIHVDVPLDNLEDLLGDTQACRIDRDALYVLLARLDFRSFIERLELSVPEDDVLPERPTDDVATVETLDDLLRATSKDSVLAFFMPDRTHDGIVRSEDHAVRVTDAEALRAWIDATDRPLVTWDLKTQWRRHDWPSPNRVVFDVMIAAYLLNALGRGDDIDFALRAALGDRYIPPAEDRLPLLEDPWEDRVRVAGLLIGARERQLADIEARDLGTLSDVEMALVNILNDMERHGVLIDRDKLDRTSASMADELDALEQSIHRYAGHPFNINSPQQLSDVLYGDLSLPTGRKLQSGHYSTNANELDRLRGYHPIIDDILTYRELSKLRGTFLEGLRKEIADDGRIHTSFNQTVTTTGRLSSSDPNLQNIPIRSERGSHIRDLFIAPDGYSLVGADYSQIELRLLACLSKDDNLMRIFQAGEDIHRVTASSLFDKDVDDITPRERGIAKTVNFSITYGISDFGLSRDLDISIPEARRLIDRYHALYPRVEAWLEAQGAFAEEHGYVETMLHRRRYVPELQSQNRNVRQFGRRAAMNAPVQGTAADLIKIAMVKAQEALDRSSLDARLILQVHDELIMEVADEDADQAAELLETAMETAMHLDLPLKAEAQRAKTWGAFD